MSACGEPPSLKPRHRTAATHRLHGLRRPHSAQEGVAPQHGRGFAHWLVTLHRRSSCGVRPFTTAHTSPLPSPCLLLFQYILHRCPLTSRLRRVRLLPPPPPPVSDPPPPQSSAPHLPQHKTTHIHNKHTHTNNTRALTGRRSGCPLAPPAGCAGCARPPALASSSVAPAAKPPCPRSPRSRQTLLAPPMLLTG